MKTITRLVNVSYCIGAAIVVFGAWSKIEHKSFANLFLTIGLLTEVSIFVIYGIMEWFSTEKPADIDLGYNGGASVDTAELTSAVKETNTILRNVFKTNQ